MIFILYQYSQLFSFVRLVVIFFPSNRIHLNPTHLFLSISLITVPRIIILLLLPSTELLSFWWQRQLS